MNIVIIFFVVIRFNGENRIEMLDYSDNIILNKIFLEVPTVTPTVQETLMTKKDKRIEKAKGRSFTRSEKCMILRDGSGGGAH